MFTCCVVVIFERSLLTSRAKVHEPKYKIFGISRIVATSWLAFVVTLATHTIQNKIVRSVEGFLSLSVNQFFMGS